MTSGLRRVPLVGVLLLAAAVSGCTPGQPPAADTGPAPTPGAVAPATPDGATSGTVMTDPAQGYRPAHELRFDGLADGLVTVARVDCTRLGPTAYAWTMTGDVGGTRLQLTFNTNRYRGAGSYPISGISESGVMTMTYGDRTAATDAAHTGTFTIDDDSETGTVDATLYSPSGEQRVSGPWSCTGE